MTAQVSVDVFARDRASRTFNSVGNAAQKNAGLVGRFGATVAGVFTGAALFRGAEKLVSFMGDSLAQASDLAETTSKATQIFGAKSAAELAKWAKTADTALGQSRQTALDGAATFGVFGKSAKLSGDELRDFARENVELAADMASFANTSPEDAILAIGAALRGESEPIRRYGVLLDDATLRQQALKMGLIETTKDALTPQQKVLAAQAQILKQTSDQQGDFARTSNGLANQQRILGAEVDNLQAKLGKKLLPIALDVTHWMVKEGVPAAEDLTKWLGRKLSPVVADLTGYIRDNKDEWAETAGEIEDKVLPVLGATAMVVGKVVDVVGDLPAPVRAFGIEAALVARVLPRFNAGMDAAQTRMTAYTTAANAAGRRTAALRNVSKQAAGMGGLLLLADGAQRTSTKLGILEAAAGGALAGGVAGPWGAVIGGALGAGMGLLARQTSKAGDAMKTAKVPLQSYIDTLDDLTAATTRATRARVLDNLEQAGLVKVANSLGIATSTMINATLGNWRALEKVNTAWEKNSSIVQGIEGQKLADWIREQGRAMRGEQQALLDRNAALNKTDIASKKAAAALAKVGKDKPSTDKWTALMVGDLMNADVKVKHTSDEIRHHIEAGPKESKVDLGSFRLSLDSEGRVTSAKARGVGFGIGSELKQGMNSGLSGIVQNFATTAQAALAAAIAAGKGKGGGAGQRVAAGFKDPAGARKEFAAGFGGFQTSIFSTPSDESTPLTVDSILAFGDAEKNKAAQAKADMAALDKMGLSSALIKQFQAQGPEGLAALHTLATQASPAQIALLNSQNKSTAASWAGLGMDSATAIWGATPPDVQGEITGAFFPGKGKGGGKHGGLSKKEMAEAVAEGMEGAHIQLRAKGGDLYGVLKTYKRDRGGGPIGLD